MSDLRAALLALHKTLITSERAGYEHTIGPIQSPNHFLQLLTGDPWFAWLHHISQLIVAIDEAMAEKEPLTKVAVDGLINRTRSLLVASAEGADFARHYFDALQRDPDIVLAHAEVARLFDARDTAQ
ncbi:MAG: hypothetical protein ABI016_08830 [Chthoniobacterales bacterium]